MDDSYELSSDSIPVIQDTIDRVRQLSAFDSRIPGNNSNHSIDPFLRGYLLQGVSRGQSALCSLVTRDASYRSFKVDLAGIMFEDTTSNTSKFKLRFIKNDGSGSSVTWFDTAELAVEGLTASLLKDEIVIASNGDISSSDLLTDLGHPITSNLLIDNDELYPTPTLSPTSGYEIDSKIGSWIFAIRADILPNGFDVNLLFSLSLTEPVHIYGPAVMTLYEISDVPSFIYIPVTDVLDVASPTPLRGGTKVVLAYFGDVGYGIIAANPREYLFTQKVTG